MAGNEAGSTTNEHGASAATASAGMTSGQWPDLYALLGVPSDAEPDLLRRRIREAYMEAMANSDHRNMERRMHYQAMMERVLPQCRRILLDEQLRAGYDRQSGLHRAGDAHAMEYAAFVNTLGHDGEADDDMRTVPGKRPDEKRHDEPRANEMAQARVVLESLESPGAAAQETASGSTPLSTPHDTAATGGTAGEAVSHNVSSFMDHLPTEIAATESDASGTPPAQFTPPSSPPGPSHAAPASPAATRREADAAAGEYDVRAQTLPTQTATPETVVAQSVSSGAASKGEAIPDTTTLDAADSVVRARTLYTPRVSVGETPQNGWKRNSETRGKRVLSETSIRLLTGIAAAGLMFAILYLTDNSGGAAVAPLRVTCASELQPFMERAERDFEASPEGAGVDIQLSPIDSRDAMHHTLQNSAAPPDVWIPSESLWRRQYDEVASQHKKQRIAVARPLLLSPTVLVARSDRAAELRRRFPNRMIPTWEALRAAVIEGAPNHFGLTDPQKSGSGAIVRMFMAREWCERNNIEWSADALARPALWKWMKGFEDNVPGYAGLAGDMVKDLALGTADRYWWAIAYESDALRWMSQKKAVEIFYLPRTNYADHPFCYIERPNMEPQSAQARARFDSFLRGPQMQKALLQNGFRPTEIEIASKVEGNPFASADYKARGLRVSGFRTDDKINYRILNGLNVQWSKRF